MTDKPVTWVLASCPFCGGDAELAQMMNDTGSKEWFEVHCDTCQCSGPVHVFDPEADEETEMASQAVSAWNRRAPSPATEGEVAELAAELLESADRHADPDDEMLRSAASLLVFLSAENERLTKERDDARLEIEAAKTDLRGWMTTFVREHFPENTGWSPLPDLLGMLSQMDNASTIARDYKARLAEAVEHIETLTELLDIIKEHWIDYDHVFSIAVHESRSFLNTLGGKE